MQPQPVWKKRWSVGAKTPQIDDVRLALLLDPAVVGVDRVEAADRLAVRLGVRAEDAVDHAAVRVEDHVHRAVEAAHRRDLVDVRAHRAGVGAVVRLRRGDERAVVRLDRRVGDDAGQDQLAAAARAPVVRLRLADRDLQLGRRDLVVQPDGRAARRDADERVGVGVLRVVLVERPSRSPPSARGSRGRASAPCPTRTSGRPCRWRRRRGRRVIPAASIASNTAGSSFEEGVGRNWLSMIDGDARLAGEELGERRPVDRARRAPAAPPRSRRRPAPARPGRSRRPGWRSGSRASSVSRCFFDSSSVAPIASGSIDSYGITAR